MDELAAGKYVSLTTYRKDGTGVAFDGTAEVVTGAEATQIEHVIAKKYGLMFRVVTWWEQRRGAHTRAGVVITLNPLT